MTPTRRAQPMADFASSHQDEETRWPDHIPLIVALALVVGIFGIELVVGDFAPGQSITARLVIELAVLIALALAFIVMTQWEGKRLKEIKQLDSATRLKEIKRLEGVIYLVDYLRSLLFGMLWAAFWGLALAPVVYLFVRRMLITWEVWVGVGLLAAAVKVLIEVAELLIVTVHETGHAVASLLTLQRVTSLSIGPLQIRFERGVKHVRWIPQREGVGGVTSNLMLSERAKRFRRVVVSGAGVFAQLVLAGAAGWLIHKLAVAPGASWLQSQVINLAGISLTWYSVLRIMLILLIAQAIWNGMLNLRNRSDSDGAHLHEALLGGDAFDRGVVLQVISARNHLQELPGKWPKDLMNKLYPQEQDGLPRDVVASSYWATYYWQLDQGHFHEAGELLDQILVWDSNVTADNWAEIAYFLARHRPRNRDQAMLWSARAKVQNADLTLRKRAEAAIALARGDRRAASIAAQAGLTAIDEDRMQREPFTGIDRMIEEQLKNMARTPSLQPVTPGGAHGGGHGPSDSPEDALSPETLEPWTGIEPPWTGIEPPEIPWEEIEPPEIDTPSEECGVRD